MNDPLASAHEIIQSARSLYAGNSAVLNELDTLERRLGEPLRVALVGSVKAGKSTLLNGLLGERIAPTDSRECTRIITWYNYGTAPAVRGFLRNGDSTVLPARRQADRLELDLQGFTAEEFDSISVTWPAPGIQNITLIDTPGTVSISKEVSQETSKFLLPEQGAAGADAVVYLLRSLHDSDIRYMRALDERTRHGSATIGSIAVLSRADELGSGKLSAMLSINDAVDRLRDHPDLLNMCETIVPVAGLMGMGATTLRQADFSTLKSLAMRAPDETQHLLVSAEHFIAAKESWLPAERTRIDLVDRFGMYGIRIAFAMLRGGIDDASALADEMLRRSGLDELRRVIDVHFVQRQAELKAHSIVFAVHKLLRLTPVPGSAELRVTADGHMAQAHTYTEMQLVGRIAGGQLELADEQVLELERILGGRGAEPVTRLGLDSDTGTGTSGANGSDLDVESEVLPVAIEHLERWRTLSRNPLLNRDTHLACKVAERSCEMIIARLGSDSPQPA